MDIRTATEKAVERNLYITRNAKGHWRFIRIKPTNSIYCCIAYVSEKYQKQKGKKIAPGKRWQPTAEDLIANDWIVTELDS